MTLFSSFYSGLSGLNTYSLAMNVIGNNIANINTVGFKAGISNFQDLFSRTISGTQRSFQVGLGVTLSDVSTSLAQGALESTASPLDVAIQGKGMFILKENINSDTFLYTRAGNFGINDEGYLVTQSGLLVQGWEYKGNTLSDELSALKIFAGSSMPGVKTTEINLAGNLNANDEILDDGTGSLPTVDPNDPTTYNFKQTMRIFDSEGGEHTVQICFQKTGENAWSYEVFVDSSELDATNPGSDPANVGRIEVGVLTFNEDGSLQDVAVTNSWSFKYAGKEDQSITMFFGTSTADGGTGLDGITQMVSETSAISFYSQNGLAPGELESVTVDSHGTITGFFTNGQTRDIAKLALASFANFAGLTKLGNNVFGETFENLQA